MAGKTKRPPEAVGGSYTAIPHRVLDSQAFQGASHTARSLLYELLRQHNGANNGHLQLATSWLKSRGWKSCDTIQAAKNELMKRELIVRTRLGGLNAGPDLFALTWLPISNFIGLDIRQSEYHPGAWHFMDKLATPKQKDHTATRNSTVQTDHSATRNSTVPPSGLAPSPSVPTDGTKTALSRDSTIPPPGNNECLPLPTRKPSKRVVGKAGCSGKRAATPSDF